MKLTTILILSSVQAIDIITQSTNDALAVSMVSEENEIEEDDWEETDAEDEN